MIIDNNRHLKTRIIIIKKSGLLCLCIVLIVCLLSHLCVLVSHFCLWCHICVSVVSIVSLVSFLCRWCLICVSCGSAISIMSQEMSRTPVLCQFFSVYATLTHVRSGKLQIKNRIGLYIVYLKPKKIVYEFEIGFDKIQQQNWILKSKNII